MDYEYTRWLLAHVGYKSNKCLNHINFKQKINAILKRVTPSSRDARKKGVKHSKRTFPTMCNEWSTRLKSLTGSHLPHSKTSLKVGQRSQLSHLMSKQLAGANTQTQKSPIITTISQDIGPNQISFSTSCHNNLSNSSPLESHH